MRLVVLRTEDGKSPLLDDEETVTFSLEGVELSFAVDEPRKHMGTGTLFITQSRVIFLGLKQSFDFDVRFIALHAVSRDARSYPRPCLYCQFARDEEFDNGECEDEADEMLIGEEEELVGELERIATRANEMFLAPAKDADLMPLFEAFSQAALLNPDPVEPGHEDDEDDDELFYNQEEVVLGAEAARVLDHLDNVFTGPEQDPN